MRVLPVSFLLLGATAVLAACASSQQSSRPSAAGIPVGSTIDPPTTTAATSTTAAPVTTAASDGEAETSTTVEAPALDVEAVVRQLGIDTLVVIVEGVVHAIDGQTVTQFAPPADVVPWSDGDFLYWSTGFDADTVSTIADLDGTIRCETTGVVAEAESNSGAVTAIVWEPVTDFDDEPVEVPYFSVDCVTGEQAPINSRVQYGLDAESSFVQHVGDQTFTGFADAEGNADMFNELGISLNGDDYAGFHTFSPDGSAVIYGDMSALAGPHFTDTVRARDTQTGELLWTTQLDNPFLSIHHNGDAVLIGLADPSELLNGFDRTSTLVAMDAATGQVASTANVEAHVLFAG